LAEAGVALEARGVHLVRRSALYSTEPVGGPPQEWVLNAVVAADTRLSPEALLSVCLEVEALQGRVRGVKNGPRTLDADILFYDDLRRHDSTLEIPHPRLHERRFVLVPLHEIAPALVHPTSGLTVAELLARCPDTSAVHLHTATLAR
ncbi:MAG TPA: 2-amino-4-hydroxy-6-hydroxymethyldihydropteridine diphosphokinase, partial [Vicinamibacteria bacterium]